MRLRVEAAEEAVIKRPTEEVFDFFASHENDKLWRPGVIEMRHLSGSGTGARYAQRLKGPGDQPSATPY